MTGPARHDAGRYTGRREGRLRDTGSPGTESREGRLRGMRHAITGRREGALRDGERREGRFRGMGRGRREVARDRS